MHETSIINEESFVQLVQLNKNSMYRVAKNILNNSYDIEDAVCSAIYKAYENRYSLKNENAFKNWILKITINEAYKIIKKNKNTVLDDDVRNKSDTWEIKTDEIWDTVKSLKNDYSIVTLLFYYEDLSVKEISKILNISQATIKTRLFRARKMLKDIITEEVCDE